MNSGMTLGKAMLQNYQSLMHHSFLREEIRMMLIEEIREYHW